MAIALADSAAAAPMSEPAPHWRGLVVVLVPPSSTTTSCATRWRGSRASWRRRRSRRSRRRSTRTATSWRRSKPPVDDQAATAAFAIVRDRDPGSGRVTIWVSNRVSGTTTMQRMQVEGGNVDRAAARLAVETVELVRASLAELWPSPAGVDLRPATVETGQRRAARARFALAAGVGRISDFGDAPRRWAPADLGAAYGRAGGFGVRRLGERPRRPAPTCRRRTWEARASSARMATLGLVRYVPGRSDSCSR